MGDGVGPASARCLHVELLQHLDRQREVAVGENTFYVAGSGAKLTSAVLTVPAVRPGALWYRQ